MREQAAEQAANYADLEMQQVMLTHPNMKWQAAEHTANYVCVFIGIRLMPFMPYAVCLMLQESLQRASIEPQYSLTTVGFEVEPVHRACKEPAEPAEPANSLQCLNGALLEPY